MLALKFILLLISCALLSLHAARPLSYANVKSQCQATSVLTCSYCKCTCGKSSAIVPLTEDVLATPAKPCTDCTRIFCLTKSGLASCPSVDETESDIVVTQSCFQRESRKDEGIVIGFILITGGLLAYAMIVRPTLEKRRRDQEQRYNSIPVR